MGSGILAGEVYERRTAELYAADAGVEDAIWGIQNDMFDFDDNGYYSYPQPLLVNGKSVQVEIYREDLDPTCGEEFRFQILSTAITVDGGNTAAIDSGTQIDAYVTGVSSNYSGLLDNVITSQNGIDFPNNPNQYDITYPEGNGPVEYYGGSWPTPADLAEFYWENDEDETPYPLDTIDLAGVDMEIGPFYRIGELAIENFSGTPATLTLTGTIYITGDTDITPNKEMTLDLNGQTIFVASNSSDPQKALWIGGKCTIIGPGVIIAVGDVYFEPNIPVGMTDPIFILSVSGETTLQPGGDFYGAIAGSVEVTLQPGTTLNYPEAGFEGLINFPGFVEPNQLVYSIASWQVSQL
jgi:hypothetical protein